MRQMDWEGCIYLFWGIWNMLILKDIFPWLILAMVRRFIPGMRFRGVKMYGNGIFYSRGEFL